MKHDFLVAHFVCRRGLAAILAARRQSGMKALPIDWQGGSAKNRKPLITGHFLVGKDVARVLISID
jgi:hypothetical protein